MPGVVHVSWSRQDVAVALKAARVADPTLRGQKKALAELEQAQRKLDAKPNAKAQVALHFGEKPAGFLATVLPKHSMALYRLEKAAIEAKKPRRTTAPNNPLHNPLADTRDKRVRHITGRQRPAR